MFASRRHRALWVILVSNSGDDRYRTATGRALVLSAAGHIDSASARQPGDQTADRGTGVASGADIRIVEHGVAEAAHAAIRRRLSFGKDIDQPADVHISFA